MANAMRSDTSLSWIEPIVKLIASTAIDGHQVRNKDRELPNVSLRADVMSADAVTRRANAVMVETARVKSVCRTVNRTRASTACTPCFEIADIRDLPGRSDDHRQHRDRFVEIARIPLPAIAPSGAALDEFCIRPN